MPSVDFVPTDKASTTVRNSQQIIIKGNFFNLKMHIYEQLTAQWRKTECFPPKIGNKVTKK